MLTFTGEDIIAVAIRHTNGRMNFFLTLGKFWQQAELHEVAARVLARSSGFALDGEPEAAEVCYSLLDASGEPYFFEGLLELSRVRLPDYRGDDREACDRQAREVHDELVDGRHLYYLGSQAARGACRKHFRSMRWRSPMVERDAR